MVTRSQARPWSFCAIFHAMGLLLSIEIGAVAVLVLAALLRRRGYREQTLDVPEAIHDALGKVGLPDRAARMLATEAAIFYYALASWRQRPFVPAGAKSFSYHRRNAFAAILYAVFGAALVEMAAVDLIVRARHASAANVLLFVDALAAVWFLGFARAVQLRPILLERDRLLIRNGLNASVDVPRANATIAFGRVRAPARGTPGYLRAAMGEPNALITLREPAAARRAYGKTRVVDQIGLVLDDPKGFESAWTSPVPAAPGSAAPRAPLPSTSAL